MTKDILFRCCGAGECKTFEESCQNPANYPAIPTKVGRKIVTEFVYPPIPSRDHDWSAVLDGYDEGDPIGRGPTETAAVADLLEQLDSRDCANDA